jgi:hypothetical protein
MPIHPGVRAAFLILAAVAAIAAGGWLRGVGPAVAQDDAASVARVELARFYDAISGKGDIADVLGEAFQVMRTDGTRIDRETYIARHPAYELGEIVAVQAGDVLTASFFVAVDGAVEGFGVTSPGEPRLATFTKVDGQWKLQSIANLGIGLATNADAEGRKAVEAWVGAVMSGEKEKVKAVLAPEFQIVRDNGVAYDAAEYLASSLPEFAEPPPIDDLVVTGYGDYLVARYVLPVGPVVDGQQQAKGPRLTVFRKRAGAWLVVAHGNFAPVEK